MVISLQYGYDEISLQVPDNSMIYQSNYINTQESPSAILLDSVRNPVAGKSLDELLIGRKQGKVVIVVSDITRPIPYSQFLPQLLAIIEGSGVKKEEVIILVATGMHRASTPKEHLRMFGDIIVENYQIIDHNCEDEDNLAQLEGVSWSGSRVRLNKIYVQAGFKIVTGLVEPHFMAGFSGGRKAICPGLVSLDAVRKFHGYEFLSHPNTSGGILKDNPCHMENTSIARLCPPDFAINIVLDNQKQVNTIISGELFASHQRAIDYVKKCCCPVVEKEADLVITSCGGYPLDSTFYQCVKGFVNSLPAVKNMGEIIAFGSCLEGIGSPEYTGLLKKYSGNHRRFIEDIKQSQFFIKDQWEFQMHIRALEKVSEQNLHFYTSNIDQAELSKLSVQPHSLSIELIEKSLQDIIDQSTDKKRQIAIFPEGPYCLPTIREDLN